MQGAFAEKLELTFPLVSDFPRYRGTRAFGVYQEEQGWTRRATFVIDASGVIRHLIDDESDLQRHARESLDFARSLAGAEGRR